MYYSLILTEIHFFESILSHWAIYSYVNTILIWLQGLYGIFLYRWDTTWQCYQTLLSCRYLFFHRNYNIIYQGLLPWIAEYKLNPNFNYLLDILAWISNRHLNLTVPLIPPHTHTKKHLWICFSKFIFLLSFLFQHHLIDCLFAPPPICNLSNYGLGCKPHPQFVLEPLHTATCFCNEQVGVMLDI